MAIENSFCLCDWEAAVKLWDDSSSEDGFAEGFFDLESTEEISFPSEVHYHLASWELLEDFADWYRGRELGDSRDWQHFSRACRDLGLMEKRDFEFEPVNELPSKGENEFLFGALSPAAVGSVLDNLKQVDGEKLDEFFSGNRLRTAVLFSDLVKELQGRLDPRRGLIIFAG